VIQAGLAAVLYIALFAVVDFLLETHAETGQQQVIRLVVVTIALVGALAVCVHFVLRLRAAQDAADRRLQAAQEEARLQGALMTIRELAPWIGPHAKSGLARQGDRHATEVVVPPPARSLTTKLLTSREREVAMLIAQGQTSREIAETLVITERTVDTHADRIRVKLGLHSRAEIVAWVLSQGLAPAARP
jgi:DNA-binding NarL/FixJ family response regulator